MRKITYAGLASALFASAAFATDDMQHQHPNPASCANFSGFFAGALLGYGSGLAKTTMNPNIAGVALGQRNADLSINGVNGGVLLGYGKNISASKVYLGLQASYVLDGAKGKIVSPASPAAGAVAAVGQPGANILFKRQDSIDVDARAGIIWGNALPYILVGWANSKIKASNYGVNYISKRANGLNLGLGVDWKLTKHVVAGLVYKYTTFSKTGNRIYTSIDGTTAPTVADNVIAKSGLNDNKFQLKLAYQF